MSSNSILLIDDDQDDQVLFSDAVRDVSPGLERITKSDGLDALKYLHQTNTLPGLIFLDLNMPRMDGEEFLTAVKKDRRLADIPVIILSTFKSPEKVQQLKRLGASYYIKKPVTYNDICSAIRLVLSGDYKNAGDF